MPTRRILRNLAIGETVANLLDGSIFEIVSAPGMLVIAAGAAAVDVDMQVHVSSELVMENSELPIVTVPVIPDHVLVSERVTIGDKITIRAENRNAGAQDIHVVVSVP